MKSPYKLNSRVHTDETDYSSEMPSYRCYGVKKKVYPRWEKLKAILLKIAATILLAVPFSSIVVALGAFYFAGPLIIRTAMTVTVIVTLYVFISRPYRKRARLLRDIKKLCEGKRSDFSFEEPENRSFFSLKWRESGEDFSVTTSKRVYRIRLLSVRSRRAILRFESPEEMIVEKRPLSNKFTVIYDLKTKYRHYAVDFPLLPDVRGREVINAIIVCPTCGEWKYKSGIGYVMTGNAEKVFGRMVYTSTGFINDLKRSGD